MIFSRSGKPATIDVNTKEIDAFLSRGVEAVFPSKEAFKKALSSGKPISIYFGIDPTGPTLHIGHAIPLMKIGKLQKMGHKVTLLIGDFTAMIGDPTDKMAARKALTREEVLANCRLYKEQASKFLSFGGKNPAKLVFNSTWLSKMTFSDVVSLASTMTVSQMLERDMFEKRMAEKKPIFVHEFLYPLMQGYDSVSLDTDAEIGGNDQTFNMLAGRHLLRSLKDKEKFVVATRLLVDPSGKKMGKTEGNMITLLDSASEMFGKVMSWPDGMILPGFELCTEASEDDIAKEKAFLDRGGNPRDSKLRLALALVSIYHGKEGAEKAKGSFLAAFSKGDMSSEAPEALASKGALVSDVLVENKIVSSKAEFKRLVAEKAIKDLKSGKPIEAFDAKVESDLDLKVGKHRFIKIRVK
ncbi:MAG: tyrosine--tRNA ligase [Candidatus Taylorbacteria bacterium]|nr:tyrosine--tRNA ligase [Candidatus Taylorbacteria bacterium]